MKIENSEHKILLKKMLSTVDEQRIVRYSLPEGPELIIGQNVTLHFTGRVFCQGCHSLIKSPTSKDAYCNHCAKTLPECDLCIVRPELCHHHLGTCRDSKWGDEHCMRPHVLYLAYASAVKVGITRKTQVPTRFIDQGALAALPIMELESRYISGLIEHELAKTFSDKTHWRTMLKTVTMPENLRSVENWRAMRSDVFKQIEEFLESIVDEFGENAVTLLEGKDEAPWQEFRYPQGADFSAEKLKFQSFNLLQTPTVSGRLLGIKGQYWLLEQGVLNIRNHTGFEVIIHNG